MLVSSSSMGDRAGDELLMTMQVNVTFFGWDPVVFPMWLSKELESKLEWWQLWLSLSFFLGTRLWRLMRPRLIYLLCLIHRSLVRGHDGVEERCTWSSTGPLKLVYLGQSLRRFLLMTTRC